MMDNDLEIQLEAQALKQAEGKGGTQSNSSNNEDSRDPITSLGGQGCVLLALIIIKIFV